MRVGDELQREFSRPHEFTDQSVRAVFRAVVGDDDFEFSSHTALQRQGCQ
jgi:hypothetical protein